MKKITLLSLLLCGIWQYAPAQTPGSLDLTFSADGIQTTTFGAASERADAVAVQPDGKIIAVGRANNGANDDFAVARYNSDGSLDNTFSGDGRVTTAIGAGNDRAFAVAVQPDGNIVVGGQTIAADGSLDFALVRYESDGDLDLTFSGDGIVTTSIAAVGTAPIGDDYIRAVALQTDGKIVAVGAATFASINQEVALARYESDGDLDLTFDGGDGIAVTSLNTNSGASPAGLDEGRAVALQTDGKIVVVATADDGPDGLGYIDQATLRYNSNGTLDNTFSGDGVTSIAPPIPENRGVGRGVAIQPDGKIISAGWLFQSGRDFQLARYNRDGSLDNTFGTGGVVRNPNGSATTASTSSGIVLQPNGKLLVSGYLGVGASLADDDQNFAIYRYHAEGTLDNSFGTNGIVTTPIGSFGDFGNAVTRRASDGKVIVAGQVSNTTGSTENDFALIQYNGGEPATPVITAASDLTFTGNVTTAGSASIGFTSGSPSAPASGQTLDQITPGLVTISPYFWTVTAAGGLDFNTGKVSVPLSVLTGFGGVATPSSLVWLKRTGAGADWQSIGGTVNGGNLESTVAFSTLSEFAIASTTPDNPLPVELSGFNATLSATGVDLTWQTASETNNQGFALLRNGVAVASYETQPALTGQGTKAGETRYAYTDATVDANRTYTYRLRSIDLNGTTHDYTQTVTVEVKDEAAGKAARYELMQNYPNPFNPQTVITYTMQAAGAATITVTDLLGRIVRQETLQASAGRNTYRFNGQQLSSGTYFYQLTVLGSSGSQAVFSQTRKMVIVK